MRTKKIVVLGLSLILMGMNGRGVMAEAVDQMETTADADTGQAKEETEKEEGIVEDEAFTGGDEIKDSESDQPSEEVTEGWVLNDDETWSYVEMDGTKHVGWLKVQGKTFYLSQDGIMQTGWLKDDGVWYYLSGSGAMQTGWLKVAGKWYYAAPSGAIQTGWLKIGHTWYYLSGSGAMQTGWLKVNGKWYYAASTGGIQTGWLKVNGTWYYAASTGAIQTGWLKVADSWYYAAPTGAIVTGNKTIQGRLSAFTANGRWMGYDSFITRSAYRTRGRKSSTNYLILVDNTACHCMIFRKKGGDWMPLYDWLCSPGKPSTPTVKGIFHTGSKGLCFGHGYTCWYYTQISGDYLLHSVKYQPGSQSRLQDGRLGCKISHGCVRLSLGNAKWIYNTIPYNTTLYSY